MSLTRVQPWQILGSDYKDSVRAATTGNIDLNAAPNSIDGVTLAKRDRVLVKNQSTSSENGIYFIQKIGTGASGQWIRAIDFATNTDVTAGLQVSVEEGAVNGNKTFQLTTDNPINLGVTPLSFSLISGGGSGGATGDISIDSITATAVSSPATPATDSVVMYVTTTGISPNKEVALKMKNEAGEEIIISSTIV